MDLFPQQLPTGLLVLSMLLFLLKHLFADFVFQPSWMAEGKACSKRWFIPLAIHSGIHAAMTFLIIMLLNPSLWWLGPLDFIIHFAIDRGKAKMTLRLNAQPTQAVYWWLFGADQALHQLTHFIYVLGIASC